MHNEIAELINKNISGANATVIAPELGDHSVEVSKDHIKDIIHFLKTNETISFNALHVISGVDWPEYFEVNYMLVNYVPGHNRDLTIKVKLTDKTNPNLESVVPVFRAADFQERETFDMFGIVFNNHPDPRRILCPDDWEGYPLRKDYQVQKVYNGMVVDPPHKINTDDIEFAARQKEIKKAQKEQATE